MTWTPSEGMKRAAIVVTEIGRDYEQACGARADAMPEGIIMQARLFDAIAKAIDQALADGRVTVLPSGAANEPAKTMTITGAPPYGGNGHGTHTELELDPTGFLGGGAGDGATPSGGGGGGGAYSGELHGAELPPPPPLVFAEGMEAAPELDTRTPFDPPKKRGRPKGSKAKKRKSAKAVKAELYPVEAAVEAAPKATAEPIAHLETEA